MLQCQLPDSMTASVSVNLEELLVLDPDVILARTGALARFIRADPGWSALRAVRQGRVFSPPELPFNWVERPHSQFKALAAQWLAKQILSRSLPLRFRPRKSGISTKCFTAWSSPMTISPNCAADVAMSAVPP